MFLQQYSSYAIDLFIIRSVALQDLPFDPKSIVQYTERFHQYATLDDAVLIDKEFLGSIYSEEETLPDGSVANLGIQAEQMMAESSKKVPGKMLTKSLEITKVRMMSINRRMKTAPTYKANLESVLFPKRKRDKKAKGKTEAQLKRGAKKKPRAIEEPLDRIYT